jgi:23S rRNA (guanine2445-N2)-methyltransferase / 23S rRNA (guanine2069-N7)-methyltransferase
VHEDALRFVGRERKRYGLILVAPPTFSNSKRMSTDFDVQRDHAALLQACGRLLTDDGVLLFSNHFRRFKMAPLPGLLVTEISARTLPPDFSRNPRIHKSWRISRA